MTSPRIPDLSGEELFRRISDQLTGGRFPLGGQWELTCRCNLECVMCYTDPFNTPERIQQELSYPEIARILEELREAGCVELCFTGGEPLARRDFLDIYKDAKQKGVLLTVFTNGTLITPEMADYWVQYPPKMIEISLHGLSPQSFDAITQGPGSHQRCVRGIELILERDLPLTLKTTGMTVNHDEIMEIKDYVDRLGSLTNRLRAITTLACHRLAVETSAILSNRAETRFHNLSCRPSPSRSSGFPSPSASIKS